MGYLGPHPGAVYVSEAMGVGWQHVLHVVCLGVPNVLWVPYNIFPCFLLPATSHMTHL